MRLRRDHRVFLLVASLSGAVACGTSAGEAPFAPGDDGSAGDATGAGDAGARPDAGGSGADATLGGDDASIDSTTPIDSSTPTDSTTPADSSTPTDSAPPTDSSTPIDSAPPTDSSTPTDSAPPTDSSTPSDSSTPTDSAPPTDSATPTDSSTPPDASPADSGPPTFGVACDGGAPVLRGTAYAPNGTDPLPNVRVYAAAQINPYPAGYCDKCNAPIDSAYVSTFTAADGTYSLPLTYVPAGPSIDFAVQIGRFRKHTTVPVTCSTTSVPVAAQTLPGTSAAGDIPSIAVSTGNKDHLDQILTALGITQFDCYEGRASTTSSPTCTVVPNKNVADVLADATTLGDYQMLLLSCAPGAYANYAKRYDMTAIAQNTQAWVSAGGRMFATDTAYDYVEQAFPDAIDFAGPAADAGAPQPVDGANVGCSPSSSQAFTVNVDDAALAKWLTVVGVTSSPSVQVSGFFQPWSVVSSLPTSTSLIADGTFSLDPTACSTSEDVPLTAQFDYGTCGRVAFSSYHTLSTVNTGSLAAQEKIMEYLIFEVASCRR